MQIWLKSYITFSTSPECPDILFLSSSQIWQLFTTYKTMSCLRKTKRSPWKDFKKKVDYMISISLPFILIDFSCIILFLVDVITDVTLNCRFKKHTEAKDAATCSNLKSSKLVSLNLIKIRWKLVEVKRIGLKLLHKFW